jgi:hypothetical protein
VPVVDSPAITAPIQVAEKTETIDASEKRSILQACISDGDAIRHRFGFRMFLALRLLSVDLPRVHTMSCQVDMLAFAFL